VHIAGGSAVVCASRDDVKRSTSRGVAAVRKAADKARAVLAATLQIDSRAIRVAAARPLTPDATACAGRPSNSSGATYLVTLEAGRRRYRYYVDDSVAVPCTP
jgi:hypothetical protein